MKPYIICDQAFDQWSREASSDGSCHTCKATETKEQMDIERKCENSCFQQGSSPRYFPIELSHISLIRTYSFTFEGFPGLPPVLAT